MAYKKFSPEQLYAVKSIKKKILSEKEFESLLQEVEILSSLDHPNIIKFHETYQDEQFFHIVMDLCSGKELINYFIQEGKLVEKKVCQIIYKVVQAIAFCHAKNICHRDLKPENILFESENEEDGEIKIIDFGLSCKLNDNKNLKTVLGTPYYMAPEVLKGKYNEKCDIWSIGAITYLLLVGEPPFNGDSSQDIFKSILNKNLNFAQLKSNFSNESVDFLRKCLNKDPIERISAEQALNHPWFNLISIEFQEHNPLHVDVLENLRKFTHPNEMKKLVLNFLINYISHKDLKDLKETFLGIDKHKQGFVDINELAEAFKTLKIEVSNEELTKIFKNADCDNNGKINYTDFIMSAIDKKNFLTKENIISAFHFFDFDNSGFIDKEDLEKAILSSGHSVIHKEDLDVLIKEVSKNSNKISIEEFIKAFENDK